MSDSPRSFFNTLSTHLLLSRCVSLMGEIGIADLVADIPQTPEELARTCDVNADALRRILRFLAAHGLFQADSRGAISNTAISGLLCSTPGSLRDQVRSS
jgi:hypothetical protein